MKLYQKLNRFPLGSLWAEGFLKQQMELGKNGICGHLHELEPEMIADPFIKKSHVDAWDSEAQAGWGAEISGNYWTGYIQFAYTLNDPDMIETATCWVDTMLKNQQPNGYLGTYHVNNDSAFDDYNAWGTACAMRGLLTFYEATGRNDVLDAVHRCMLWFCEAWAGDKKTVYAGPFIIEPMIFTYHYTGDSRLVAFAEDYLNYLCKHDIFDTSYKSMLENELQYNSNHTAGLGAMLRLPALVYTATGKEEYLKASQRRIDQILKKSVHLTGSPVSVSEYLGPVGSTTETEYCSYAFYNATYSCMSWITGQPRYGDLMEQLFYNGAQGARKKDEKAIAYLNAPNQIYATDNSSSSASDMQVYAPCYPTSCCPVNAVAVIPEFIRGMLLHDEKDNIYAVAYGPCRLTYKDMHLVEKTSYPFRNHISFEILCSKSFVLNLKIPAWCKQYSVTVNSVPCPSLSEKDGYISISRDWNTGDTVDIYFKAQPEILQIDDSDCAGKHPLAIRYGALVFAYHIPEKWNPIKGRPMTALPEGWSWYNVTPDFKEAEAADLHERIGLRRNQYSWNIALDEQLSPMDIIVEELPEHGYVWENPMIKLHTFCYKAPYLCAPYPSKTFEPYDEYPYVTDRLELALEPYGCTNLRITYFPKAKRNRL